MGEKSNWKLFCVGSQSTSDVTGVDVIKGNTTTVENWQTTFYFCHTQRLRACNKEKCVPNALIRCSEELIIWWNDCSIKGKVRPTLQLLYSTESYNSTMRKRTERRNEEATDTYRGREESWCHVAMLKVTLKTLGCWIFCNVQYNKSKIKWSTVMPFAS